MRNKMTRLTNSSAIVSYTRTLGVGGFFLGLLIGLICFTASLVATRIVSEIVLSIFVIRDTLAANGTIFSRYYINVGRRVIRTSH
jgi:hypothetical protein